ncbi:MAG TPA: prepilin peptidase [Longimicrobiales bacterium]|nr:prepilin peptidase [Longimicrobiales bacterium]
MTETALTVLLVLTVAVAAVMDVRTRRIPNVLTLSALGVALALRALLGWPALGAGLLGAGVALALLLPLFAMGGVGGGDAKLLVAVGGFLGLGGFITAVLATAVFGGVMAVAYATRRGVILPLLLNTGGLFKYVVTAGHGGERRTKESPGAVTLPYGVAIAAGTLFAIWYGGVV